MRLPRPRPRAVRVWHRQPRGSRGGGGRWWRRQLLLLRRRGARHPVGRLHLSRHGGEASGRLGEAILQRCLSKARRTRVSSRPAWDPVC
eukprot:scaffold92976_cov52-Phaeocystis_antarctica.AAC.2